MDLILKRLHERIRELVDVQAPTASKGQPLFLVPFERNPAFTGREDVLAQLDRALLQGSGALSQITGIGGLGGVGKTQTAVEYVYRHKDQYTAVLWTVAESEQTLASGYADIARKLDLAAEEQNQAKVRDAVKAWLEQHAGWLLVLDNADTPALVKPYLPHQHRGCVLVTSRAYTLQDAGIIQGLLHLDTLPPNEACALIFARTQRDASASSTEEQAAATALVQELGYLPLAIEQAAAYLVETGVSFTAYLASFRKRRLDVPGPAAAATTWALNFAEVEKSPASADLLRLSAFLAPDTIPLDLLALGSDKIQNPLGAALAAAMGNPLALDELLAPLLRYSLVKRDPGGGAAFSVHRLIQALVRDQLGGDRGKLWAEIAVAVFRHALDINELAFGPSHPNTARSLGHLALLLKNKGDLDAAEPLYRRALAIHEQALGANHPRTATSLSNLAFLLQDRGDLKAAEPLVRRALAMYEQALGATHPHTILIRNNLIILLTAQGRTAEADALLRPI